MLYIVATPIGNLGEITYRAVEVLKSADAVLCEDTRRTGVLLDKYAIKKPLISYQKFSEREKAGYIADRLEKGETLALVSDAGMPLVSDPGKILLDEVIARGLEYTVVSGPCALINAAVLSGLDISAFCMCGFLPEKKSDRKKYIERFSRLEATLLFYSPPHNVRDDIEFLFSELGDRRAAAVREISKLHEEVVRGTLGNFPPFTEKGEFVLAVEGAPHVESELNSLSVAEHVNSYIDGGMTKMDAVKKTASDRKTPKSAVYAEYENYLKERKI